MLVNNIFGLVNKFSKEEDQISASFGFILKNNRRILNSFLRSMKVNLSRNELKKVDIETQVPYDSGKSRIDLQLTIYDNFLVFVESKLYKNVESIYAQLKKYCKILGKKRPEYNNRIRLVYVNKQLVGKDLIEKLRLWLGLSRNEFFFFSWEDLIRLTEGYSNKEVIKLFREYVGDTMYSRKLIREQKIKDIVEVLVVYTTPLFWELAQRKGIAVQRNATPDARYIAFLRTHRGPGRPSAITHIAEVKYTESNVPQRISYKGFPKLIKRCRERGHALEGTHKHYVLGQIIELSKEIPHKKGEGSKGQVNFRTKMSELLRVKSVGEIRTLRQIESESKS